MFSDEKIIEEIINFVKKNKVTSMKEIISYANKKKLYTWQFFFRKNITKSLRWIIK